MKDNLEKYFQKHFNKKVNPQEWNTPSEEVWSRAINEINKEEKRKKPLLWLWAFSIVLAILMTGTIVYVYILRTNIGNLQKIHRAQTNGPQKKNVFDSQSINYQRALDPDNAPLEKNPDIVNENTSLSQIDFSEFIDDSNSNTKRSALKNQVINYYKKSNNIQKNIPHKKTIEYASNPIHSYEQGLHPNNDVNVRQLSSKFLTQIKPLSIQPILPPSPNIFDRKVSPGNIIFISGGATWASSPSMGNPVGPYESMYGNEKLMPAYHLGLDYHKSINLHWRFILGLRYKMIHLWSMSTLQARYDKNSEYINEQNQAESLLSLAIPSSLGMLNTKLRLIRPANMTIENGALIDATVELNQNIYMLSFPLGIIYHKPFNSKFSWNAGFGATGNLMVSSKNTISPEMSHKDQKLEINSSSIDNNELRHFLSIFVVLGIDYTPNDRFIFGLHTQYDSNITPYFESPKIKTRFQEIDWSLKLGYKF